MKTFIPFALLVVAALGGALLTGCSPTAAYSGDERGAQIDHNFNQQLEYAADDVDYMLMLRPESTLTYWNIYHRN
jgi:hypothetical protein